MAADRKEQVMSATDHTPRLPATFNRLAWSNLAAQSAEQIALAAAPIVAVLLLGVGEGQTGALQTALTLPFILFAIPAGLLADRISRRWLMAGSEALRAAALAGILVLIWLGLLTLPLLALLGFVAVCGTVAYSVAAPALVPSLVSSDALPAANARIELARTVAFASGPALGGVLVGWVGAAPAFGFAAALSIMAVVLLSGIYEPARAPAPRRHPLQEIREGAVFVLHHPLLRPVFVTQFIFNTASFLLLAVFVPYAVRHPRTVGDRGRRHARDVRRRHGRRRAAGDAGDAAARLRHRDRAWAGDRLCRRRRDGADHMDSGAVACGL
jgi:Arabinose efflux permease